MEVSIAAAPAPLLPTTLAVTFCSDVSRNPTGACASALPRGTMRVVPGGRSMVSKPGTAVGPSAPSTCSVTDAVRSPGFTTTRSRVPLPAGKPAITTDVAGSAVGGSQSPPADEPPLSMRCRTAAATRPAEVVTRSDVGCGEVNSGPSGTTRRLWAGTMMPREPGAASRPPTP